MGYCTGIDEYCPVLGYSHSYIIKLLTHWYKRTNSSSARRKGFPLHLINAIYIHDAMYLYELYNTWAIALVLMNIASCWDIFIAI